MDVRVWGVIEDRLIELRVQPLLGATGIRIEGLPEGRTRTTADRVRAALVNSGYVPEAPSVLIRLEPAVAAGRTSDLDLAIALAALACGGRIDGNLRWILATGRLGPDGAVHARGLEKPGSLVTIVTALSRAPAYAVERMFGSPTT